MIDQLLIERSYLIIRKIEKTDSIFQPTQKAGHFPENAD